LGYTTDPRYQVLVDASVFVVEEIGRLAMQCLQYSSRLSVKQKFVETGGRGGAYYVNDKGNKIWLKKHQKDQCRNGTLLGSGITCPRQIRDYTRRR
jgi:hypothetical protein